MEEEREDKGRGRERRRGREKKTRVKGEKKRRGWREKKKTRVEGQKRTRVEGVKKTRVHVEREDEGGWRVRMERKEKTVERLSYHTELNEPKQNRMNLLRAK